MQLPLSLRPLNRKAIDAYIALQHDPQARAAAIRAIRAIQRLTAAIQFNDMLVHAAGEQDPKSWLQGVENVACAALQAINATHKKNTDGYRADSVERHRFDSAAMSLVGQLRGEVVRLRSFVDSSRQNIAFVTEILLREGITLEQITVSVARRSFGVSEWKSGQSRQAIANAQSRLAGIDAVLGAAARTGEGMPEAVATEMATLQERLQAEIAEHRKQLDDQCAEVAKLESLALRMGLDANGPPELLVQTIGKAERDVAEANARIVEAEGHLAALEFFLGDPLRTLATLPAEARGRLLEQAQVKHGITEWPRRK